MRDLARFQSDMALALLDGRFAGIAPEILIGPVTAQEALSVHRNTALAGAVNALRLTHPTALALVGDDFFDQAALAYVKASPPRSAWLTGYGAVLGVGLALGVGVAPGEAVPCLAVGVGLGAGANVE